METWKCYLQNFFNLVDYLVELTIDIKYLSMHKEIIQCFFLGTLQVTEVFAEIKEQQLSSEKTNVCLLSHSPDIKLTGI